MGLITVWYFISSFTDHMIQIYVGQREISGRYQSSLCMLTITIDYIYLKYI